jgi:hypothetical protein
MEESRVAEDNNLGKPVFCLLMKIADIEEATVQVEGFGAFYRVVTPDCWNEVERGSAFF